MNPQRTAQEIDDIFYLPADQFFPAQKEAITYADVSLATHFSRVLPGDTDPTTQLTESIRLATPIISADMDTVTGHDMAIAMALAWGIGILHSNFKPEEQIKAVGRVKHAMHGVIEDPITITPEKNIGDIIDLIETKQYTFKTFPVVDKAGTLIGLLSSDAVKPRHATRGVSEVMKPLGEIKTVPENEMQKNPIRRAEQFFTEYVGINKLLIIDEKWKLKGLVTASDIERITQESSSLLKPTTDSKHRLSVWATLYLFRNWHGELDRKKILSHTEMLVERWVDIVALSSAHAHTESMGDAIAMVRKEFPHLPIMAGNVTSAQGVDFLAKKWANTIKIGQGPGAICTTRVVAWVGIPQMTALYVASQIARQIGVTLVADGGITGSWDMVKALATWGDAVMVGSLLAGCIESPWEVITDGQWRKFKVYRGMGSVEAMKAGSAARYGQRNTDKQRKLTPEGVVGKKPFIWPVSDVMWQFLGGIQSGMGYHGARTLEELRNTARYTRVSPGGQTEAKPHDLS